MNEFKTVLVLSVLAILLVMIGLVAVCVNPWAGAALTAIFAGVAGVIRAIRGPASTDPQDDTGPSATPPTP